MDGLEDACEVVEGEDGAAPDMPEELVELWRVLGRRRSALFVNACGRPSEATCYSVEGRQARCVQMYVVFTSFLGSQIRRQHRVSKNSACIQSAAGGGRSSVHGQRHLIPCSPLLNDDDTFKDEE